MQRAVPFCRGKPPKPPKSVIVNRYPLLSLRSGGRLTHNPPLLYASHAQGALGVAHCMTSHRGWLRQPPSQREGGSVWQIFTLEQLKSHSGIFALNRPPIGRSVAYRHCITGYCYSCVSYGITHRHKTAYTAPKWLR